jgi:hypothetical protein
MMYKIQYVHIYTLFSIHATQGESHAGLRAVDLSSDQRPMREDERTRIVQQVGPIYRRWSSIFGFYHDLNHPTIGYPYDLGNPHMWICLQTIINHQILGYPSDKPRCVQLYEVESVELCVLWMFYWEIPFKNEFIDVIDSKIKYDELSWT